MKSNVVEALPVLQEFIGELNAILFTVNIFSEGKQDWNFQEIEAVNQLLEVSKQISESANRIIRSFVGSK